MENGINETSAWVLIGGNAYEFAMPKGNPLLSDDTYSVDDHFDVVAKKTRETVETSGLFFHEHPTSKVVTYLQLMPGVPVMVIPGSAFKRHIDEQRRQQMLMQMAGPQPIRRS